MGLVCQPDGIAVVKPQIHLKNSQMKKETEADWQFVIVLAHRGFAGYLRKFSQLSLCSKVDYRDHQIMLQTYPS
jgi:hypothetical protein